MTVEASSVFADLDVLLVNSEKFNQLFIQKIQPAWMEQVLSRISRSPIHFSKFFDILVDFVVSENHPEWCNRALRWLTRIFESPELADMTKQSQSSLCRFLSFAAEMHGLHQLLGTVVEMIDASPKVAEPTSRNFHLPIYDTGYVFIDDQEVNFGIPKKRSRRNKIGVELEQDECGQSSLLSNEGDSSVSDDYEEGEEALAVSEDDGVFDVDNGSTSSLAESQVSNTLPRPQASVDYADNSDSSSEEEEDNNVENDETGLEDDEEEEGSRMDLPPQSGGAEEEREEGGDGDVSIPVSKGVHQVRRSARIRNRR
ncbi:hypothetical protein ECG_01985 [Echinococcus granulosus]|nr:hypothetical protein ECG_01985 [Echinococcus granulosus]